jgi:hypothetical protein
MMWMKSIKALSWIASIGLVSSALFLAYIILFPVDVIKGWKLELPAKNEYALGEVVVIESMYSKTVPTGNNSQSERYIECRNNRGVNLRYLLNKAVANRKPSSSTGTGIVVQIPRELSGLTIPTTCFFSISISYNLYPRQAIPEYNRTKDFKLIQESEPAAVTPAPVGDTAVPLTAPLAQAEFRESKRPEGSSSSSSAPTTSPESEEAPVNPEPEEEEPSLLDRLRGILGGLAR